MLVLISVSVVNYGISSTHILEIDGLVKDCGISSADALEIPQSCTKALM